MKLPEGLLHQTAAPSGSFYILIFSSAIRSYMPSGAAEDLLLLDCVHAKVPKELVEQPLPQLRIGPTLES